MYPSSRLFVLRAARFAAVASAAGCAGSDTPSLGPELASDIAVAYAGGAAVAAAASTSTGGSGGASGGGSASGSGSPAANGSGGAGAPSAEPSAGGSNMAGAAGASEPPAAAGSAGSSGDGELPAAGEVCDGFAILAANCSTGGCHGEGSNLGTFAASEAEARSYIDKDGTVCSNLGPIIDPDDPSGSLIIRKLSDSPPCGNPMPLIGDLLSPADIDCIEEWMGSL